MKKNIEVQLRRRAVGLEVGGFRPSEDPLEHWFGRVNVCAPGETWPESQGKPMFALCQINLTRLPFRPPRLDDLAVLAVFIDPERLAEDTVNGDGWCLRAYPSLEALVPLQAPKTGSWIKSLQMKPVVIEKDYPCHEDIPIELPEEAEDEYEERFKNVDGVKLGGWPSLLQSEIYWAPFNKHPIAPEYVFQIDSVEKAKWMWGDSGVGYFGRGMAPGKENEWALAWQCL